MKRNFELIREILMKTEEESYANKWYIRKIESYSSEDISNHIKLLGEKGYLKVMDLSNKDGEEFVIIAITMEGYDYVDSVRNKSTWSTIKKTISSKGLEVTFDVLKSVLSELTKSAIAG